MQSNQSHNINTNTEYKNKKQAKQEKSATHIHESTQQSQNHWGNIHSKRWKQCSQNKIILKRSTRDSRTTATFMTLKNTYVTRKSKERPKNTQQRTKKYIVRSSHKNTTSCKKRIETIHKRPSIEAKCNIRHQITK